MANEILVPSEQSDELVLAENFIKNVYDDLNDIKHSFFRIGFRLHEAAECGYYKQLGYKNITELAEDKFGFSSSTTYEFIGIYRLAHRKDAPFLIADRYDKFSQTQLREFCRLKYDPEGFIRIVKPSDIVAEIGKAVTFWNKYVAKHSGTPSVNSIKELLQLDIDTPLEGVRSYLKMKAEEAAYYVEHPEAEPLRGQLPGQISIELTEQVKPEEIKNSAYAEFTEPEKPVEAVEEPSEQITDDEIIKYCLKDGTGFENGKFRVYEKFNTNPLKTEFIDYVKNEYGTGSFSYGSSYYQSVESYSRGLVITRKDGSEMALPWAYIAGRISRLIETCEYLSIEEQVQYVQWKAMQDGLTVSEEPTNVAEKTEDSAYAEKLDLKNDKARREWLDGFRSWGVWLEVPQVDMTFYRYNFANGAALIIEVGYEYWSFSSKPGAKERIAYSIIDDEHKKFNSKGISYTDVIKWLSERREEI